MLIENPYFSTHMCLLWLFVIFAIYTQITKVERKSILGACICGIVLIILVVGRPYTMSDYIAYVKAFMQGADRMEPSFQFIRNIFNNNDYNYLWMFAVYAIISVTLKVTAIYKISPSFYMSILIWISYYFFYHDLIAIRASVACALLLWMIKEKVDDNKKIVIGLIFLSTLFHYTAAIYAVIFFISSEKQYKPLYFWSIPISYALYFAGVSLISLTPYLGGDGLNELYESYSSKIINYNSFNLIQLCNCLICMFFWYRVDMFSKYSKYFLITLKLFTIGCCIGVLFGNIGVVATRLADMFWSVEIILFPFLMYSAAPHAKCIKLIPVIVAIVLFYFSFNSSHWDNGLLMI